MSSARTKDEPSIGAKAFAIVAGQLKTEISAENSALSEEISLLEPFCAHLNRVEIRVRVRSNQNDSDDDSHDDSDDNFRIIPISSGLEGAGLLDSGPRRVLKIAVDPGDGATLPLAEFGPTGQVSLFVSKQRVGTFPSDIDPTVNSILGSGSIKANLYDATGKVLFQGRVDDLSNEDYESIRNEVGDDVSGEANSNTLSIYLRNGLGMRSPNATFTPEFVLIQPERLMKFKGRGLLTNTFFVQRYKNFRSEMNHKSFQAYLKKEELNLDEAAFKLSRLEHEGAEVDQGKLDEIKLKIKETGDDIQRRQRACDELKSAVGKLKEHLFNFFAELIPDYDNYVKTSEDELRDLVFAVDNSGSNRSVLNHNYDLKLQKHNLLDIKNRVGHIEIFYDVDITDDVSERKEVCVSVNLDASCFPPVHPISKWTLQLPEIEIDANKLHSFDLHLSGVSVTNNGLAISDEMLDRGLIILGCRSGLTLLGHFKFDSIESRTETLADETFGPTVRGLFNNQRPPRELPEDCKFVLEAIVFSKAYEDTLKMLGCIGTVSPVDSDESR